MMQHFAFCFISDEILLAFLVQLQILHVFLIAFLQDLLAIVPAIGNDLVSVIVLGYHLLQPFHSIFVQQENGRIKAFCPSGFQGPPVGLLHRLRGGSLLKDRVPALKTFCDPFC